MSTNHDVVTRVAASAQRFIDTLKYAGMHEPEVVVYLNPYDWDCLRAMLPIGEFVIEQADNGVLYAGVRYMPALTRELHIRDAFIEGRDSKSNPTRDDHDAWRTSRAYRRLHPPARDAMGVRRHDR